MKKGIIVFALTLASLPVFASAFTLQNNAQCVGGILVTTYGDVQDGGGLGPYTNAKSLAQGDCDMLTQPGQCCSVNVSTNGGGFGGAVIPYTWFNYEIYDGATVQPGFATYQTGPLANTPGSLNARVLGRQGKYFAGINGASCTPTATNDQWYTSSEQGTVIFNERLENGYDCALAAQSEGYTYWNQTSTIRPGEFDPAETVCIGYQTQNGTIAKPPRNPVLPSSNTSTKYRSGSTCGAAVTTLTASLVANPNSIINGEDSLLTWSSTGAVSCVGTNFSTGGATSGSITVTPRATTQYTVTCTGQNTQTVSAQATVTVADNGLQVSCRAHPSRASINEDVLWSSTVVGPQGTYLYSWTGTDELTGTTNQVFKKYTTVGQKDAWLTVKFTPGIVVDPPGDAACTYVKQGEPYFTKVCTGGTNSMNIQQPQCDDLPNFPSGGAGEVGKICKQSAECEPSPVDDQSAVPSVYYGNVQNYICGTPTTPTTGTRGGTGAGVDRPLYLRYWNTLSSFLLFDRTDPQFMDPNYVETVQMIETTVKGATATTVTHPESDTHTNPAVIADLQQNGGVSSSGAGFAAEKAGMDRVCAVIHGTGTTAGTWGARKYNSPGNNTVMRFNGTTWTRVGAKSFNSHLSGTFTCIVPGTPEPVQPPVVTNPTTPTPQPQTVTVKCESGVFIGVGNTECTDGVDNNGDGKIDDRDPGCKTGSGAFNPNGTEGNASNTSECSDGIDNNGDGTTDFPEDLSCSSADDNLEFADPAELTLSVNPPLIKKDQQCTVTLSARNVASCSLSGSGISKLFTAVFGIVTTKEVMTPGLSQTSTYTLSCKGLDGKVATKKVDCKIAPTFEEI